MHDLTVTEWARTQNISKQAGYNAVKRCGIPVVDGRVDSEVATALYKRRTRKRMNGRDEAESQSAGNADESGIPLERVSYEEASRRRQVAEAQLAEIRLQQERGALVHVEKVRSKLAAMLTTYRASLLLVPDRLAATLAAESDPAKVREALDAEIRLVMTNLVKGEVTP